ncbi:hypothetical protein JWS72_002909 [Enterococcus faecalis]|uniref:hypothetical protein n=1 Tax=Enterococcus faecalis TaxID=1351 RepID=UPI00098D656B|nr:hypothetical protein [Enterococcus faecalis]MDF4035858.1 hypothetical protein [Staphylococcus aureus]EGO2510933.1 hypothetical protein [Enterococcus faecalis]EGO5060709.1 hypothetical protein [Enterococcus faecalis]EHB6442926.1 hypothetical protein [Enterococcus faecalis]EHE8493673.1 hypothetical protein [Enterococcus faecalis]
MEDQKILQLLNNPLISGYNMEVMTNSRLYSANVQRYRTKIKNVPDPLMAISIMRPKMKQLFLEIAEEVARVQPKNKQEVKEMVNEYCYREAWSE